MFNTQWLIIVLLLLVIVVLVIALVVKHRCEPFGPLTGSKDYNNGVFIPKIETNKIDNLFDLIYPLNAIYITTNKDFDPNTMGKDEWTKTNGFLIPFVLCNADIIKAINDKSTTGFNTAKQIVISINDYDEVILNSGLSGTYIDMIKTSDIHKLYVWKKTKVVSDVETFTYESNKMKAKEMNINKINNSGLLYPIGSLYYTTDENFNPNTTLGGKWVLYNKDITPYGLQGVVLPILTSTIDYDKNNKEVYGFITHSQELGQMLIDEHTKALGFSSFTNRVLRIWERVE